jgi:hypothetical protein
MRDFFPQIGETKSFTLFHKLGKRFHNWENSTIINLTRFPIVHDIYEQLNMFFPFLVQHIVTGWWFGT